MTTLAGNPNWSGLELERKTVSSTSQLDQLKKFTRVVADTGDFASLKQYAPEDATTNPTLILKAAQMPQYAHLLDQSISYADSLGGPEDGKLQACMDRLAVSFGKEILLPLWRLLI